MAEIKPTERAIALHHMTISAAIIDKTKRDSFRGFGTELGTLGLPSAPFTLYAFGGILELHHPDGGLMAEIDLNGAMKEIGGLLNQHKAKG